MAKKKKKVYRIEVNRGLMRRLLRELNAWGVSASLYSVAGDVLTTSDTNAVDVALETFADSPNSIEVTAEPPTHCGRVYYDKDHLPSSWCYLEAGHAGVHRAKLRGGSALYQGQLND